MANVLRIIFFQILLCSFSVSAPLSSMNIPEIENLENKNCNFPPANLYIGRGTGHSLVNCKIKDIVEKQNQTLRLDLCHIFWESLNDFTCNFTGNPDFMKGTNDSEVQQYCDKTLKKVFDDAGSELNCTTLCTKNKFAKELCTLIHFATNITLGIKEKSSQKRTDTEDGTDTTKRPGKKILSSTKQTQLSTTTTNPNKNTTKPKENTTATKPKENTSTAKLNKNTTSAKPKEDTTAAKPNKDTTTIKPNEDTPTIMLNKNTTTAKANKDTTTIKPNEDTPTITLNKNTTTAKPNKNTTSAKSNKNTTSAKPKEDTTATKPNKDTTTIKPNEDTPTIMLNKNTTTAKPNKDTTTIKPNKDTPTAKLNNTTTTSKKVPSTTQPVKPKTTTLNQENTGSEQQEHNGSEQQENNRPEHQENNGSEQQQNNNSEQQQKKGSEQQQNNGSEQQNQGSEQQGGKRTEYKDPSPEPESEGHFMAYFLTAVVLCVAGYVIFHNKQKIVAFIVEGRTGRRSSRRSNKGGYSKLKPSVDDVMPSLEKSTKSTTYVY